MFGQQWLAPTRQEVRELDPDVTVNAILDAKHYHYDPVELIDLADFHATFVNLVSEDSIMTVDDVVIDEHNGCKRSIQTG